MPVSRSDTSHRDVIASLLGERPNNGVGDLGQDRPASLVGLALVARCHHDERAIAGELPEDLEPEAAVRARHDGDPAGEVRNVRGGPGHGRCYVAEGRRVGRLLAFSCLKG
jgi:hypothetical protein